MTSVPAKLTETDAVVNVAPSRAAYPDAHEA